MGWEWNDGERRRKEREAEDWMTPAMKARRRREDRLINLFMFCVLAVAVAYLVFEAT